MIVDRTPARPGPLARVLALLVHRDRRVPAPVDEEGDEHAGGQGRARIDGEGVEPVPRRVDRALRCLRVHLPERDHREEDQRHQFGPEQKHLSPGRQLDADIADPGHGENEDDAENGDPERVDGQSVGSEQQERVAGGDGGQAGHDEQVGDEDAPTAEPSQLWPHGPGHPREGRAAVGVGPVEVVVRGRDEQHRHEGDQHDRGRLKADLVRHETERRGDAVTRCGRGDADDDHRDQPEGATLEALRPRRRPIDCFDRLSHVIPPSLAPRDSQRFPARARDLAVSKRLGNESRSD